MTSNTKPAVLTALNNHVVKEFSAHNLYLAASFYFAHKSLNGIAKWCRAEAESERKHGMDILDFLTKRGHKASIPNVAGQAYDFENDQKCFEALWKAETDVTAAIDALMNLAQSENDHHSYKFLQAYADEQLNSESELQEILDKVKAYSALPGLMFHLDAELGH